MSATKSIASLGVACLLMAIAAAASAASPASVALSMSAEKEITVTDDNGNKALKRISVAVIDLQGKSSDRSLEAAVVPGDEVIYTINYTNLSKDAAAKVVITNPIPEHMNYKGGSADGANTTIEFSVDGQHFAAADRLLVTMADGKTRPARAEDYTRVRWTLGAPLAPGKKGHVSYRAVLQ